MTVWLKRKGSISISNLATGAESQHLAIGQASLEPLLDFVQALGHDKGNHCLICNDTDAMDKLSSLKTFLKQSYYQFSHCFWDSDVRLFHITWI